MVDVIRLRLITIASACMYMEAHIVLLMYPDEETEIYMMYDVRGSEVVCIMYLGR